MSRDIIFKKTTLVVTMFSALFSAPLYSADLEKPLEKDDIIVFDGDWQVKNLSVEEKKEWRIRYDEESLPGDVFYEEGDATFMVDLRNVTVADGMRLTLRIDGGDAAPEVFDMTGYGAGASFATDPSRSGASQRVNVEMTGGSMMIWGAETAGETVNQLAFRIVSDINAEHHLEAADMLVLQDQLWLTPEDYFAVSATLEEARAKNANLYLGRNGTIAVDRDRLSSPDKELVHAEEGARVVFEKGSSIVVLEGVGGEASLTADEVEDRFLTFINNADAVTGLGNVTLVFGTNEEGLPNSQEGSFEIGKDGSLVLVSRPWESRGELASPVNEFHRLASMKDAPEVIKEFLRCFPTSGNLHGQILHNTLMQKSLGSGPAMERASDFGGRFGTMIFSEASDVLPVTFEIIGSRSEGEVTSFSAVAGGLGEGTYERETEGAALGLNAGYGDWIFGGRLLYEDSDVDFSSDLVTEKNLQADSTLISGSAYIGRRMAGSRYMADLTWTGVEDKVSHIHASDIRVGSDDISRRSVSGGVTGVWEADIPGAGDWRILFTSNARLTNYLASDYSVKGNGIAFWNVEEDSRWVYSLGAGMNLGREWHRYTKEDSEGEVLERDDWIRLGLSSGVRVRGGDIDIRQTVSVGNASASIETEDLARWEGYAGIDVDAVWKGSRVGISADTSLGPDGYRSSEAKVKVVWEY